MQRSVVIQRRQYDIIEPSEDSEEARCGCGQLRTSCTTFLSKGHDCQGMIPLFVRVAADNQQTIIKRVRVVSPKLPPRKNISPRVPVGEENLRVKLFQSKIEKSKKEVETYN